MIWCDFFGNLNKDSLKQGALKPTNYDHARLVKIYLNENAHDQLDLIFACYQRSMNCYHYHEETCEIH